MGLANHSSWQQRQPVNSKQLHRRPQPHTYPPEGIKEDQVENVFPGIWPASTDQCAEDSCCQAGAGDGDGHVQPVHPSTPPNPAVNSLNCVKRKPRNIADRDRLTQSCYKKCIPPNYQESELNKGESVCLDRCVSKFFDVNNKVFTLIYCFVSSLSNWSL